MSVPAIAVTVCSTAHHSCQIAASADFDLNPRAAAVAPSSSSSAAVAGSQKSVAGGLSRIFSASSSGPHPSDLGSFRHERSEELGGSYSYSTSPFKCRDPSPVTVFRGPASCGGGGGSGLSRSPPLARTPREWMGADRRTGKDRIFKGFVRNAISSCLDYTSSDFLSPSRSTATADELPFGLEDSGSDSPNYDPYAMELLAGAQSRHKIFCEEVIIKAFYEAERAHRGQMRASGDPYLHHCVETSVLLAKIGANTTVVAAGLLHDTLDDSFMDYDHIFHTLGANVADLVEGVSRLSHLSKLARDSNTASKAAEADRLHTIFLAMADTRAVLIKLADRLHNMMTLEALPAVKQQRFAKETLEIFAPLASRLGISTWKEQLENLCFKYLHPEKHRDLSLQLLRSADDEALVASASQKLGKALTDEGVSYHVLCGRHKSLYSIYSKMVKKKLNMDQIHDINGLRLIVDNKEDCYKALNIVRRLWHEVIGRFKDYITCPKFNGYQSLHTVVMGEGMLPLEVQIRTKAMHLQAEYGIAAHWRYKEGSCSHPSFVLQMVEWARWVLSWHCETLKQEQCGSLGGTSLSRPGCRFPSHSDDCPYAYTQQCGHDGPMYIIIMENEKMSVQEFPAGTTILDLMERGGEGSPGGSPCSFPVNLLLRPRLNHKPVTDPCQKLKMGDVVELAPELSDKSLTEYREEIQRMYERGLVLSGTHG